VVKEEAPTGGGWYLVNGPIEGCPNDHHIHMPHSRHTHAALATGTPQAAT
jgi:hypothetical protein